MNSSSLDPRNVPKPGSTYRVIRSETAPLRADVEALTFLYGLVCASETFPKRGLHTGGILTGSLEGEIRLDGVRALPAKYRTDPAWQLSAANLALLQQSVMQALTEGASVIGHFRIQTSGEPEPSAVDESIASIVGMPDPVLVLIPALPGGVEPARLYRRVSGEWVLLSSFPLIDSPPIAPLMRAASMEMEEGGVKNLAGVRLVMAALGPRWSWWMAGGLAVMLAGGAFWVRLIWQKRPAGALPTPSEINLVVQPSGGGLRVQWNPASPQMAEGAAGIVTVQDGTRQVRIPLDRKQLHNASIFYVPESGWVEVRLEIYRDGNHYAGEAVALATGVATPKWPEDVRQKPSMAAVRPSAGGVGRLRATEKARGTAQKGGGTAEDTTLQELSSLAAPKKVERPLTAHRQFSPLRASPPPAGLALLPPPPEATPVRAPEIASPAQVLVPPSRAVPSAIRYETAVPIRKVRPAVPANLHSILPGSISVEVGVEIDAEGKVVNVTPVEPMSATQKLLAPQAAQAARLWRFEPARRNGVPVGSESRVKFDFERDAH